LLELRQWETHSDVRAARERMSAYSDGPVAARESFPVPTEIAPLADSAAKAAAL